MKKILFIIPTLTQTNGVAAFMINYVSKFKLDKFEVEVIYNNLRPSKTYIKFFEDKKINIYKLPYVREVGLKEYCKAIKSFFEEHHDYDLIYSNVAYQTYFFYKEAKKYGINNFAIHAHATQSSDNKLKNFFGNIIQKRVNKIANHKFACSKLAGKAMFKNTKFTVINNAVDYNKYKYDNNYRKEIRKELNINDNSKILGFVGRYTHQKNVFFFKDLIKKLPEQYKVLMIGNGQQKKEFLNRVKEESLDNRFIFIEETFQVNEYYSAFDYFLLPSLYEGLPIVGVEAQVNGLPCLLSDTISDECKISDNIVYININNLNEWISNIEKMQRNSNLKLNDDFNINVQARKFEDKLKNICR